MNGSTGKWMLKRDGGVIVQNVIANKEYLWFVNQNYFAYLATWKGLEKW